jgi:hypothetical protein
MSKRRLEEPTWEFPFIGMGLGESFFIPTNNTEFMTYKVKNAAKEFGAEVIIKARVEENILGIRVWRVQ